MKITFVLTFFISILFFACGNSKINLPKANANNLKVGDLLFQDIDCGSACDAIEAVTFGFENTNLSHVAIVTSVKNNKVVVTEAIGDYVQENSLEVFLKRSNKVLVGRLKSEYNYILENAIDYLNEKILGKPYDNYYLIENNSYYCSEVIYESFKEANKGKDLFLLHPMTFKDPKTNDYFFYWKSHYESMNMGIPEGKPGLNPGGMSKSNCINIIAAFEMPSTK